MVRSYERGRTDAEELMPQTCPVHGQWQATREEIFPANVELPHAFVCAAGTW